jgi:hypothetical protein
MSHHRHFTVENCIISFCQWVCCLLNAWNIRLMNFLYLQQRALIEQQELRRVQKEQQERERLRLENEKRREREEEEALEKARYLAGHSYFIIRRKPVR